MPENITIEEANKIIEGLEKSLDASSGGTGVSVFEITDKKEPSDADSLLRFECPTEVWEQFVDYCRRNELDPTQQIREAVITYYKNLWATYKIRKKLYDESKLI